MAIFKLGAIITEISGSIGGTTFRKVGGTMVASTKSRGASITKLRLNPQLGPIRHIFSAWQHLAQEARDEWNATALLYEFPDKFGTLRNITGYQLFVKLNIQLLPVGAYIEYPTGITDVVNPFAIDNIYTNTAFQNMGGSLYGITGPVTLLFSAQIKQGNIYSNSSKRNEVFFTHTYDTNTSFEVGSYFYEKYPFFDSTYQAVIKIQAMNAFGFKGSELFIPATVTG